MPRYSITDQDMEAIDNAFTYHKPKDDQPERYEMLRKMAKALAMEILHTVPPGRPRAVAMTKLEETIMWANKGIACGE